MGTEDPAGTDPKTRQQTERTQLDLSHESADEGISDGARGTCLIPMMARVISVKVKEERTESGAT